MKQPLFSSTSRSRIPRREGNSTSSSSSKMTTKKKKEGREEQGNSSGNSNNRNPFQDLSNGGSFVDVSSSMGTISSSSVSSIEAPRCCLRFFLNHSAASTSKPQVSNRNNHSNNHTPVKFNSIPCKTPNSAPSSRPSRRNSEKVKGIASAYLCKRQSGKNPKPNSRVSKLATMGNPVSNLENSGSGDRGCSVEVPNLTPLRMIVAGSSLNVTMSRCEEESSNTKTPPLHASVSPEIQQPCQSSAISTAATNRTTATTTPVCYGAGHLLSGVTDKRKCRPRGLLVVGEAKPVDKFDIDDDHDADDVIVDGNEINLSPSNSPVKASMHWLLSPVNKENEYSSGNGGAQNTASDMDISPLEEDRSPFSMDLLCSVNIVQTPESDSGEKGKKNNHGWGFELDSVDQHWPVSSSFRFDLPTTTPHSVVDLSRFQNPLDIRESQLSTSTFDDMSHSEVRISWRDGLVSRIFEMDELDCCCKCLSDEEEDLEDEPHQTHKIDLDIEDIRTSNASIESSAEGQHHVLDGKAEDGLLLPAKVSCDLPAESMNISTDGGALFRSDDSDWTQCYKNQLFKV
ncbi:unnamed protein product [Linum tenue]|uniref:Uncharacterized protein n=1 Tax=Linum tenue TaxID=586396 RepID=A0AAV0IKQ8_9ROSI|nr:unnamed protein product [Linum tenue]